MHTDQCYIWDRVSVGISGSGTRTRTTAWLTALTPDSCWPMFMMMMETSCQRRERWDSRLSTDRRPSALSDCSSRRISSSSSSTFSQPRRRWSAEGDRAYRLPWFPASVAIFLRQFQCFLTFLRCLFISFLDEHVPGALWEEGQQHELYHGRNPSQTQHEGPTWTQSEHRLYSNNQLSCALCFIV